MKLLLVAVSWQIASDSDKYECNKPLITCRYDTDIKFLSYFYRMNNGDTYTLL